MPLDKPRILGILWYPSAQAAAVYGLRDLFETASHLQGSHLQASHLQAGRGGRSPGLEVRILQMKDALPAVDAPLTALILPPCLGQEAPSDPRGPLSGWLMDRHREGTLLCSVCAGAFLLAETGLLAGRPATTHWALRARFAERFPEVALDTDKLIIDDGDLMTAGGLMAWVDLGLRLVDRFLGPTVMLATARYFLVDPGGREQRFYSTFAPTLTHGDAAVLKAQRWLQGRSGEKVTLPQMAAQAGLGERTFLRRFHKATGLKPTEYLQHLRVGKARELLEQPVLSIDEIAWQVGYEDPGAFRKTFQRVMGISLGEYRRRFAPAR